MPPFFINFAVLSQKAVSLPRKIALTGSAGTNPFLPSGKILSDNSGNYP
jgi:hypothetical protein